MSDSLALLRDLASQNGDVAKRFGLPNGKRLTPGQYRRVEASLKAWTDKLVRSARAYPAQAYRVGLAQIGHFLRMAGREEPSLRSERSAQAWLERYTGNELAGAMQRYGDEIRSALLYGLHHEVNPLQSASWLHHATHDAREDWRLIARTETARANALGRLHGAQQAGYSEVWIPPHAGACEDCREMLFGQVFPIETLLNATNYKRKRSEWVPALPMHPRCRCTALPHVPEIREAAQDEYSRLAERGLDDETLQEMFEPGGQLRPQFAGDPRLLALFGKTIGDPYAYAFGEAVQKVAKGFFDTPRSELDPLVWQGERLKPAVRDAIERWWVSVVGDWRVFGDIYITGSATSFQWETGWRHPWLGPNDTEVAPDVDTHLFIDYVELRDARPEFGILDDASIRVILEARVNEAKHGAEVLPGVRLDAFIRTEPTFEDFESALRGTDEGVYDVGHDRWLIAPTHFPTGETFGERPLQGAGGALAGAHPDWLAHAEEIGRQMTEALAARDVPRMAALFDRVFHDRRAGYVSGAGETDRGNFTWQWLENFGPLVEVKALVHAEEREHPEWEKVAELAASGLGDAYRAYRAHPDADAKIRLQKLYTWLLEQREAATGTVGARIWEHVADLVALERVKAILET